jgi:hypothetical protein
MQSSFLFSAGPSPCVVIQPVEFVHKHFSFIYSLALAWVIVVAVASVLSRKRKGKLIFRPKFAQALFTDQWRSGRSFKSLLSRIGGARNCLWIAVADGELWVGLHFPFNLMFMPEWSGLEYRLRGIDILSVEQPLSSGSGKVLIRYRNATGKEEAFEITVRNVEAFNRAIDEIRNEHGPT